MTFVPLTHKNFVVNKISNTISIDYKESDTFTYISDNSLDSKSLINTNNFIGITNKECNLLEEDDEAVLKKNRIKAFYSNISNKDMAAKEYFEAKSSLNENNIFNDNIKDFNFRNFFKIERIEQKFLPNSFELQKKNIIKNSLYKDYSENYSLDFYKDLNKGFCNYNSINFFSQRFDEEINHTNCIVWPNPYANEKHLYDLYENSFTVSFYLNLRKNYSNYNQPECLLHIPNLLSIYFVRSISIDNGHRICIVSGDNSCKKIKEINSTIFNSSNKKIDNQKGTYISADLNINNNRWYNISLSLNKNADNSREIEIFIDGIQVDLFDLSFTNSNNIIHDSYICLGNKPDYLNDISGTYKSDLNKIFYQFFGSKFNNDKPVSGPAIEKDLSLGNSKWIEIGQYSIEDIIFENEGVSFEPNINKNSESFHGELHDLRIYLQALNQEKIEDICSKTIEDIETEVDEFSLCFYVPVFYTNDYVYKRTSINASNEKVNTYFSCIYNPYLSNTCGALQMSSESFLLDFVSLTKPNIVIGGNNYINTYNDNTNNSLSSMLSLQNDSIDIKKGVLYNTIYNKNISNTSHAFFNLNKHNNLSYRNLLILPNDNGIPKVSFDILEKLPNDFDRYNFESARNYHISTDNIIDQELHNISLNQNLILDDNSLSFEMQLQNSNYRFMLTNDLLYNVSNIIYHDNRITDVSAININDTLIDSRIDKVKSYFSYSDSNPVIRNYKQSIETFDFRNINNLIHRKTYLPDTDIIYKNLLLPYAASNLDYDCLFTTIFDVSSKLYNKKINKNTLNISDNNLATTNSNIHMSFKDDGYGLLYRSDCLTKQARWNYVGHAFYKEGIVVLNRPELTYFGQNDFNFKFDSDFYMYVHEINIPAEAGTLNKSSNLTYNKDLRHDSSAFNSESSFVYITDINLHDENLNIIAKAKLARPAPKKNEDNILFKLKMDY